MPLSASSCQHQSEIPIGFLTKVFQGPWIPLTIFDYFYDYSCTWLVLTGFWFYTKPIVCLFIAESIFHLRGTNPIVKAFLTTVSQCALTSEIYSQDTLPSKNVTVKIRVRLPVGAQVLPFFQNIKNLIQMPKI